MEFFRYILLRTYTTQGKYSKGRTKPNTINSEKRNFSIHANNLILDVYLLRYLFKNFFFLHKIYKMKFVSLKLRKGWIDVVKLHFEKNCEIWK